MHRRSSLLALAALAAVSSLPGAATAQPASRTARIAVVNSGAPASFRTRGEALVRALRELGYEEGRNLQIEWISANGQEDLLREVAHRLARQAPDLVVSGSTLTTRALYRAGVRAPIVMAAAEDPVAEGFVKSLANPGGNITGIALNVVDHIRRQLELLAAVAPRLRRITALLNPANTIYRTYRSRIEFGLPPGMKLTIAEATTQRDIERAFTGKARDDTEGLIVMNDPLFYLERRAIAEQALAMRRPAVYPLRGYVEAGGLLSWGPHPEANLGQAASMVDRIIKGANPAQIAVEPAARFELALNRATARATGITPPAEILREATLIGT